MRQATKDTLARVAAIYTDAGRRGQPPTTTVATRLGVTHASATGLVRRARRHGLLPATSRGRASAPKHAAATATIYRGTEQEQRWETCCTCHTPWPCPAWRSEQ